MAKIVRRNEDSKRPGAVLLADLSGSMAFSDFPDTLRRVDRLAQVLSYVLSRVRLQALVGFNDWPFVVELGASVRLPEPEGGTALHLALDSVAGMLPVPERVIVLSDGVPNDVEWALAAARTLRPMPIDAYFCGREGDLAALEFMKQLAEAGGPGGRWDRWSLSQPSLVAEELRLRIAGPR